MPKIVHNVLCGFSDFNRSKSACDRAVALGACEFGSALLGALSVLGRDPFRGVFKTAYR